MLALADDIERAARAEEEEKMESEARLTADLFSSQYTIISFCSSYSLEVYCDVRAYVQKIESSRIRVHRVICECIRCIRASPFMYSNAV